MVIVIDNESTKKNLYIVENDLTLLWQIKIPTIFLDQETGLGLLSAAKNANEDVILAIDFPMTKAVDHSHIMIVNTVDDFRSYDFVEKFEEVKNQFKDRI